MYKVSRFFTVAVAISAFLFAYSPRETERHFSGRFLTDPMLKPREMIGDMVITTGVENTIPFWILCSNTNEDNHSIRVDCGELSYDKLAIGHTFGVMDLIRQCINWEDYNWEMSLDGHPIDLKAFGVSDIVRPDLASSSSPVREVFRRVRLWNVVLVNPTGVCTGCRARHSLLMERRHTHGLLTLRLQHRSLPSRKARTSLASTESFTRAVPVIRASRQLTMTIRKIP